MADEAEKMRTLVAVWLVDGPFDGLNVLAEHGRMFLYMAHGEKEYTYGLGDDGKYHYCPEIEGDEE